MVSLSSKWVTSMKNVISINKRGSNNMTEMYEIVNIINAPSANAKRIKIVDTEGFIVIRARFRTSRNSQLASGKFNKVRLNASP